MNEPLWKRGLFGLVACAGIVFTVMALAACIGQGPLYAALQ